MRPWFFADTAADQALALSLAVAMNALPLAIAMGTAIDARTIASKAPYESQSVPNKNLFHAPPVREECFAFERTHAC